MDILENETASAFFMGLKGAAEWANKASSQAGSWIKQRVLDVKSLLKSVKSGVGNVWESIKGGWNFLGGWFRDDPLTATAGVAAVVLTAGVLVVSGGAVIGALGGGIAGLAKIAGVVGTVGTVNAVLGNPIQAGIRWLIRGVGFVYNFNWNISDSDIRAQQQALMNGIIVAAGGSLGQALGGLACGATAGLATVRIDVGLMADLWEIIDEETQEEVLEAFQSLILLTKMAAGQMAFLETYKNVRKWAKANIRTGIKKIDEAIASWGEEGSKPWSFALKVEEFIESIDNPT